MAICVRKLLVTWGHSVAKVPCFIDPKKSLVRAALLQPLPESDGAFWSPNIVQRRSSCARGGTGMLPNAIQFSLLDSTSLVQETAMPQINMVCTPTVP